MPATRRVGLGSDAEFASSKAERGWVSERTGKENGVCMSVAVPPNEIVREQRRRKHACPACPVGW
jgi:hypothetical protein